MIVIAHKKSNGIFIPFEQLQQLLNKEFTEIKLDVKFISFKNEIVNKTSGLLSDYNLDGVEYQNELREEWNRDI